MATSIDFGTNVSNPSLLNFKENNPRRSASNAASGTPCVHCGRKTGLHCAKCGRSLCSHCLTEGEDLDGKVCIDCL
jgi:hypothetical protein